MPESVVSTETAPASTGLPRRLGARTDAMLRGLWLLLVAFHLLMAVWSVQGPGVGMDAMVPVLAALQLLLCLGCLLAQRRGRGVQAAGGFVVWQLLLLTIAYGYWGLGAQSRQQVLQGMPVLLVAALLGARPLRRATLWLCAAMVVGAWVDLAGGLFRADRVPHVMIQLGMCVFGTALVAWLLHHSVTGLRESLQLAQQHGVELARKRDELQLEMQ